MSTRSDIGILNQDGTVTYVYVHNDGYPQHHVPILSKHYKDEATVRTMIMLGDMSSLAAHPGTEPHDFDKRPKGICNYYGRDRGEKGTEARVAASFDAYDKAADESYAYVYRGGAWEVREHGGKWMPVADLLAAAEAKQ